MKTILPSLLSLTALALAADAPVPADPYPRLLPRSAALIQQALKDEKPNRRVADRARVVALILAEAAQQDLTGKDTGARTAVRDAAIALARAIQEQEFDKARKLAQALPSLPASSRVAKEKTPLLGKQLNMDELMSVFRKANLGGLEIEAELDRLESDSENQTVAAGELNESLELLAYQTALAGGMLKDHRPDKNVAEWGKYSENMRRLAQELGQAVRAKDGKAAFQAVAAGNANCTACHKAFR
jgi:hypothetical protein